MNELFDNIKEGNRIKLLQFLEANTLFFKKNSKDLALIFGENRICIVKSGHIQVIKNDYNGNTTIIEDLQENSIFGTITQGYYNTEYSLTCKEDSYVIVFDFESILQYDELKTFYNQFLKNLIKILSNKIIENNNRIEILTNKTIRDKILTYLQLLAKKNKSSTITIPFSYSIMADYLAINRSAMARELKNLKDEGLIETKGRRIKLLFDRT